MALLQFLLPVLLPLLLSLQFGYAADELHCSKGGTWCPPGQTCGGPICGPGPRCCDENIDAFLQRPVNIGPPRLLPPSAQQPEDITEEDPRKPPARPEGSLARPEEPVRRRCPPNTKCIDNFPCEQGGGSCPAGQTCGGTCGPNTCCSPPSSACGEGGDVCPVGYTCRPCPLRGGACCCLPVEC